MEKGLLTNEPHHGHCYYESGNDDGKVATDGRARHRNGNGSARHRNGNGSARHRNGNGSARHRNGKARAIAKARERAKHGNGTAVVCLEDTFHRCNVQVAHGLS
jgi:hypothetical protein